MTIQDTLGGFIRYTQGERPGMRAGRVQRSQLWSLPSIAPISPILIQQVVGLADVSFWQGEIDFTKMKQAGLAGVIIRAGQRTWEDTRFKVNWANAKMAGLPRGSYWFYDSRQSPEAQAKLWWTILGGEIGELVLVADFEENYNGPYGKPEHFRLFIETIQRLSGVPNNRIVIYTGYFWWTERVGANLFFKKYKVWIAWYAAMQYVKVPAPWTEQDLLFWQYTSSGPGYDYGVSSSEIDLNYYCCSTLDYINWFGLTDPVPPVGEPPMDETPYFELKSNSTTSRSVREGPAVTWPKLSVNGDLFSGKIARAGVTPSDIHVYAEDVPVPGRPGEYHARRGDIWRKIYMLDGRNAVGWIAEIHRGEVLLSVKRVPLLDTPSDPVEPVPTFPDLPVTIVLGDDVLFEKQTITTVIKRKR